MTPPGPVTPDSGDELWPSASAVLKSWALDRIAQWDLASPGATAGTELLGDAWAAGIQRDLAEHGYTITRDNEIRAEVRNSIAAAIEKHRDAVWTNFDPAIALAASTAKYAYTDAARIARGEV